MCTEKQTLVLFIGIIASILSAVIYSRYQNAKNEDFNHISSTSLEYHSLDSVSSSFQLAAENCFEPSKTDNHEQTRRLTYTSLISEDDVQKPTQDSNKQTGIEIETSFVEITQGTPTTTESSITTDVEIPFYSINPDTSSLSLLQSSQITLQKSTNIVQQAANNLTDGLSEDLICYNDVFQDQMQSCRARCKQGSDSFSLPGMKSCHQLLTCKEINTNVISIRKIDNGTVKGVFLGSWNNYQVAILKLQDQKYADDFISGLNVLRSFSGFDNVVQLIGYCQETWTYVTEYHLLGNIINFFKLIESNDKLRKLDTIAFRFRLCIDYVRSIVFLHNSPSGTRVMCDANELGKIFHQYLVTNQLKLILSDLDAVPVVNETVICGKLRLTGSLLAPEQVPESEEDDKPKYNEKIDIWRIPDVCDYFLGNDGQSEVIRYHLFNIHNKCKNRDPSMRPTAKEVVHVYDDLAHTIL